MKQLNRAALGECDFVMPISEGFFVGIRDIGPDGQPGSKVFSFVVDAEARTFKVESVNFRGFSLRGIRNVIAVVEAFAKDNGLKETYIY